ncbi:hypothetical protein UPYG_G00295590 [Umbra pygmaea]|uniref:Chemokine interleukin-8-like domain-containing protein n=1 Tax=Umbra pygmaea TaxID=75934 RepID=A0ABD0W5K4_UMBPY
MPQMSAPVITLFVLVAVGLFAHSEAQQACCTSYTQRPMPIHLIRGYSIQTIKGRCNLNAIIFHLLKFRNVCVDPTKSWVMENIRKLREKAEELNKNKSKNNNNHK